MHLRCRGGARPNRISGWSDRWRRPSLALALAASLTIVVGAGAAPGPVTASTPSPGCAGAPQTAASTWPPVAIVPTPHGACGYWIASSNGGVFDFGAAGFFGSTGGITLDAPIVGMAAAPTGGGYWLVASDGGVFAFGTAGFHGSTGGIALVAPIVGMVATPTGGGYWLVASDGGVFAFGSARFYGSMGGMPLDAPVVDMGATPTGGGYWLVASDGGVFAFGSAPFEGSMGGRPLVKPVVTMAADPSTGGYWLFTSDGGVFAFGAPFLGSMGGQPLHRPVIDASATDGQGYLLLGADGGVFNFGDAPFLGTAPGPPLAGTVIALDPGHDGGNGAAPTVINQPIWNGVENEPCDTVGSETAGGYPEHLFNWNVAQYLEADLRAQGATVVLTRDSDDGVGPCVNVRAGIGNDADAAAAVSIHADGGPPGGRGFAVLEPVADGINNAVVAPSAQLAVAVRNAFATGTGEPVSTYDGIDGIQPRSDLGGLNLTTVPKVLIECANMQNLTDATLLVQASWQQQAAASLAQGLSAFMSTR
jgi:N-acetylmuramoyl-L-alanine amidase